MVSRFSSRGTTARRRFRKAGWTARRARAVARTAAARGSTPRRMPPERVHAATTPAARSAIPVWTSMEVRSTAPERPAERLICATATNWKTFPGT
jgi:hypothetical protein